MEIKFPTYVPNTFNKRPHSGVNTNNDLFLDIHERTQHCKVTRRCNVNIYSDVERWGQEEENGRDYKLERESPQRTKAYKSEGRGSKID